MATITAPVRKQIYRRLALVLALAGTLTACGGGGNSHSSSGATFAYDASTPLDLSTKRTAREAGVAIRDVSFKGAAGETIPAYLVVPRGKGPHPAVIYAHGSGGSRRDLLPSAVGLAEHGAVALLLDMRYSAARSRQSLPQGIDGVKVATDNEIESVVEVRRAVDLLQSLPYVDKHKIGYVGWSAGARTGAITAGVEHRIRFYDLLAGGALPISSYVAESPEDTRGEVEDLLGKTDPLRFVALAAPSSLLFQDGRHDEVVPRRALIGLERSASKPKELRWYDSGHVPSQSAWSDSLKWLSQRLGLT
ncbi:MAG TPA: acetylxylan esterase [Gaiellaceae bacterium]|nr:acetylxylan esterase [Gaiellaceae bacterium]